MVKGTKHWDGDLRPRLKLFLSHIKQNISYRFSFPSVAIKHRENVALSLCTAAGWIASNTGVASLQRHHSARLPEKVSRVLLLEA